MIRFIAILFFSAFLFACKKDPNTQEIKLYNVKYNIGCNNCMVVYVSDSLGTQQTKYNQNSTWSYNFFGKKNQEIILLAYNTSDVPQTVNVKIAVNDSVIKDKTTYCAISGVSFAVDTVR